MKYLIISIGILLTILIFTNPSNSDFQYYMAGKRIAYSPGSMVRRGVSEVRLIGGRETNFLVCSIFKYNTVKYLGIFGNFIKISEEKL